MQIYLILFTGTFAVVSMMTASLHTKFIPESTVYNIAINNTERGNVITPLIITSTLTFGCGIFQVNIFII